MPRTKISEFSATAADNTDIDSIDIAEGCAPSGINNAIRELMAQLKDFQAGTAGDPFNGAVNGTVGATTPAAGTFTNLAYSGTLTGGTGVVNIGSGQVYKDASGNVGIGTSSPSSFGRFAVQTDGGTGVAIVGYSPSTTNGARLVLADNYSSAEIRSVPVAATLSSDILFRTGNADRLRLDSSGNLGLGVTPSAWGATRTAIDLGTNGYVASQGTQLGLLQNAFFNGTNWIYKTTGAASRQLLFNGEFTWSVAPSGTAGNAISFTQAMTLDASGNLLVGTTNANLSRVSIGGAGTSNAASALHVANSSNATLFIVRNDGLISTGAASLSPYNNTTGVGTNMVVGSDGLLYRSTSSLKYKTDIQDSTHGLAAVMNLRPVTYKGKNDGDKVFGGLIAEEVHEAGLTEFVQYAEDGTPDALNYGNMVSLAFKAIQELKAEFDAYKLSHP